MKNTRILGTWILSLIVFLSGALLAMAANEGVPGSDRKRFSQIASSTWEEVFFDSGVWDWKSQWSLDGLKSEVTHSKNGMDLEAGPVPKEDASHTVLWTKQSFSGDLMIEYEYTRTDEAKQFVTILYIQATGSGEAGFPKNIREWANTRTVPAMRTYFNNMNSYHISYSAYGGETVEDDFDYIRARRYMPLLKKGLSNTELNPDEFQRTGLFAPGVLHNITVIKKENELFMMIKNPDKEYLCHWVNDKHPEIVEGRIGLRHMFTRSARYKNFRVSTLK
jgi:hypothetical protein